MSQATTVIADGSGAAVLSSVNGALDALLTLNSGAAAPVSPEAYQFWFDTTLGVLKQRNSTNTAWLVFGEGVGGQCRLTKSGANLLLSRFGGNKIVINGELQAIPSAGVTLAPTALSVGTTYYIYAYMSGATMTLEASATGHSQDSSTGVEIKTGSATHTLVGMARIITGPAWVDTAAQRFVRSWYNDKGVQIKGANVTVTTASNTFLEVSASGRGEFLSWAVDPCMVSSTAYGYTASTNNSAYAGIGLDSATTGAGDFVLADISGSFVGMSSSLSFTATEGYHYVTPTMRSTGGVNATVTSSLNGKIGPS